MGQNSDVSQYNNKIKANSLLPHELKRFNGPSKKNQIWTNKKLRFKQQQKYLISYQAACY